MMICWSVRYNTMINVRRGLLVCGGNKCTHVVIGSLVPPYLPRNAEARVTHITTRRTRPPHSNHMQY